MQEKKYVKNFRLMKIIEFVILSFLELTFIIILITHPSVCKHIYDDSTLFILCLITWISSLFFLLMLLYDFLKLKSFALESHELNREAYLDNLTGIPNRHGLDTVLKTYDSTEALLKVGCYMATISNLSSINDTYGHEKGDEVIQNFCNIFEKTGDTFGTVGRNGGNDFVLIMTDSSHEQMDNFHKKLQQKIDEYNSTNTGAPISFKGVYLLNEDEKAKVFTQLMTATYNKLHV